MNPKTFSLFTFSIFALVFVMGMISAATIFSDDFNDGNLNGWTVIDNTATGGSAWTNTGTYAEARPGFNSVSGTTILERTISTVGFESIVIIYDRQIGGGFESNDSFTVLWTIDGANFNLLEEVSSPGNDTNFSTQTFNLPSSANDNANFKLIFDCTANAASEFCRVDSIIMEGTTTTTTTPTTHPSEIQSCISTGNLGGNLNIDIRRPVIVDGFGDRDKWYVFDTIEVEIRVKNNGPDRVEDILLGWGVYSHDLGLWIAEGEERAFDLRSGRTETLTISFKLDDARDIEDLYLEGSSALRDGLVLYAWAQGEDEEFDFKDTCAFSARDEVEIEIERDFVALHNLMHPETVQCGTEFQISANVWNLGNRDQDNVRVQIYNSELGINSELNVGTIDEFSKAFTPLIFNHKIPSNIEEKSYVIRYTVLDRNRNTFETRDRKDAIFYSVINVQGNCEARQEIIVTANLESKAQASQEMTVKIILTNAADITRSFVVEVDDYQTWAEISELPDVLTLDSGSSGEVLIRFNVKDDASGQQTFNAKIYTSSELIATQPVTVDVDPKPLLGITWFSIDNENWPLWACRALNIILVIIIIIVAIRLARK